MSTTIVEFPVVAKKFVSDTDKQRLMMEMRAHHKPLLDKLKVPEKNFYPKMVFMDQNTQVVGVFKSEFEKADGLYTEIADRNYEPADPKRRLYHLPFNTHYMTEYVFSNNDKWLVPFDEFREINTVAVLMNIPKSAPAPVEQDSEETDANVTNMTIRDVCSIIWKKPISNKGWLNALINTQTKTL